jgi:hypothetical protein
MVKKWRINLAFGNDESKWLKSIPRPPGSDVMNDSDSQSVVGGGEAGSVLVTAEKQLELKRKQAMVIIELLNFNHNSLYYIYILFRLWHIVQGKIC